MRTGDTLLDESIDAYEVRAVSYGTKFCPRVYTPSDVRDDAVTFCGLFDSKHKWGASYLSDLGREDLVNLHLNFDTQMLQLEAEDRVMIIQLTAQRYVGDTDDAIERIAIDLHGKRVDSQRSRLAAREYAITQDRRRVETAQHVLANALAQSEARIKTLDAQISTLLVDGAMIDAEILQKELDVERSKLDYLNAIQRGLQVQQDIADVGLQRARTESEIAKISADVVQWDVRTAENAADIKELLSQKKSLETQLAQVAVHELDARADTAQSAYRKAEVATQMIELQSQIDKVNAQVASTYARTEATYARTMATSAQKAEVDVQIAQTESDVKGIEADIIRADVDIARTRLSEADAVVSEAEAQIEQKKSTQYWPQKALASAERAAAYNELSASYASLVPLIEETAANMANLQTQRYNLQVQDIQNEDAIYKLDADARIAIDGIRSAAAKQEADAELEVGEAEIRVWDYRRASFVMSNRGAVEAARILATADVVNNLTHVIAGG